MKISELRDHLVVVKLAGEVATGSQQSLDNCQKLLDGHPDYTFGLSDWKTANFEEVRDAVVNACGKKAVTADPQGPGWIDPDAVTAAILEHRERLSAHATARSRVLLATGHPTGLLAHYMSLARALHGAGCQLLVPLDDHWVVEGDPPSGLRFLDGVGCARTGGDLVHTHRSVYMEAMLQALDDQSQRPDLVLGDHGMAGSAIERGIDTLGIADVNDPALFLAQNRGRTTSVLPIDDNLAPHLYQPVTAAMLDGWR